MGIVIVVLARKYYQQNIFLKIKVAIMGCIICAGNAGKYTGEIINPDTAPLQPIYRR